MKGLTFILSLYVFALVLMPCFDNEYHQNESMSNINQLIDGNHLEICSPLCSDHDCHTHITLTIVDVDIDLPGYWDIEVSVLAKKTPIPFIAIWQPPKIS